MRGREGTMASFLWRRNALLRFYSRSLDGGSQLGRKSAFFTQGSGGDSVMPLKPWLSGVAWRALLSTQWSYLMVEQEKHSEGWIMDNGLRAGGARFVSSSAVQGPVVKGAKLEDMIEVSVDGRPVSISKGMSVLQACEVAGIDIPRFCYHPRLSIAGNCRMCLVEVEKTPKPVASCAMPVLPGMKIKTATPLVKKAREGVMEFLLMNHPLDCPICDQGGECDLQDQSMVYGSDRGRYFDSKRTVVDKQLGPFVKTVMTRCIQCTSLDRMSRGRSTVVQRSDILGIFVNYLVVALDAGWMPFMRLPGDTSYSPAPTVQKCVRFATEIAGVQDLGVLGRGGAEEIGTYVERLLTSEIAGNVIDICPVGALTPKPFAFSARSWELKSTESIDVTDSSGANIRIDSRGPEVMRVLPRLNEDVNEEWISDKIRFGFDGLKRQRLNEPMIRSATGQLEPVTWAQALKAVAEAASRTQPSEMVGIAGKLSDAESMVALKDFLNRLGCERLQVEGSGENPVADLRSQYLVNSTMAGLEQTDVALLIGTELQVEAPLLNLRLRKSVRTTETEVAVIGPVQNLHYAFEHLGSTTETLMAVAEGQHPFCKKLAKAKYPSVVVGSGVLLRKDKEAIFASVRTIVEQAGIIREDWNGYNFLLLNAAQAAGLDLGFVPGARAFAGDVSTIKFLYLLGADDLTPEDIPEGSFVVYQGHHGDRSAYRANVILPGVAFTEKEGTYENIEGRTQTTRPAVPPVGDARDDWKIVRALSEITGVPLPYDTVSGVRSRLSALAPNLVRMDWLEPAIAIPRSSLPVPSAELTSSPFVKAIDNFYMTDSITRASKHMAQATAAYSCKNVPPTLGD